MAEYDELSYSELQAEAGERGLPATGTTEELVERLEEDDAGVTPVEGGSTVTPTPEPSVVEVEPDKTRVNQGPYVGVDAQYENAASHHFAPVEPTDDEDDESSDDED